MIRYAVDHGVNYIDSAYFYHRAIANLLSVWRCRWVPRKGQDCHQLPCIEVKSAADFDRLLNEQLKKLQVQKIDFYLLHGLNAAEWPKVRDLGVLKWRRERLRTGRIGHLGFSFHDEYKVFQEIIDAYDKWTLCQIQ